MEEEREALRRQIHMLQDLINSHKNAHGNAPAPSAPATSRWQNPAQPTFRSQGVFRGGPAQRGFRFKGPQQQQQPSQGNVWKKKYSLVNKASNVSELTSSAPATSHFVNPGSNANVFALPARLTVPTVREPQVDYNIVSAKVPELTYRLSKDNRSSVSKIIAQPASGDNSKKAHVSATGALSKSARVQPTSTMLKEVAIASKKNCPNQKMHWTSTQRNSSLQQSPVRTLAPLRESKSLTDFPTGSNVTPLAGTSKEALNVFSPPKSMSTPVISTKIARDRKTKYTWVANPAKTNLIKKISPNAKKIASVELERKSPSALLVTKVKKHCAQPKTVTPKNRYKWKAEHAGQGVCESVSASSLQSDTNCKTERPSDRNTSHSSAKGETSAAGPKTPYRESAHSSYKVKSRTKIIRRRSSSSSPVEKKPSPLAPLTMKSHYCLRRRTSPRVKSPPALKKISPKGLVHITKHQLRRVPPAKQPCATREGSSSPSLRTPPSSRVIKTRYRIVKKSIVPSPTSSPLFSFSSSYNWRARLVQLNKARHLSPSVKFHQHQQRWKSRGLRCIGGVMYRVSANKLSKTSPMMPGKQPTKTVRLDTSSTSPGSSLSSRISTPSRYIASRAVQRSLAIIRQAKQKKVKKKEYCMYYNRFGKCNRDQSCPYIHDPEKVAVCTRFLRGTCKKTDGTCPFSHKVSKEKMPVCSYFLKGICHNNDCPYSHVYVSRKAEICQDFLKGYCPMGEKCKKKHTLLCPDYARNGTCPKGSKCKLQHRQKKRRLDNPTTPEHAQPGLKQRRPIGESLGLSEGLSPGSDVLSASTNEPPGSSTSQKLPSFISLDCSISPSSDGSHRSNRVKPAEDTGKPLQIKPRLRTSVQDN
ncbi:zinc finger CCCH domain-containing protein 3 [Discoglossus pictus]